MDKNLKNIYENGRIYIGSDWTERPKQLQNGEWISPSRAVKYFEYLASLPQMVVINIHDFKDGQQVEGSKHYRTVYQYLGGNRSMAGNDQWYNITKEEYDSYLDDYRRIAAIALPVAVADGLTREDVIESLRQSFWKQTGTWHENSQGVPNIEYIDWLEEKIFLYRQAVQLEKDIKNTFAQ